MAFNTNLLKKNEAIEVERHRLSDLSRVTKPVSVRAEARSQPTYPVISHHPPCGLAPPTPGWLRKDGEERGKRKGKAGECGMGVGGS